MNLINTKYENPKVLFIKRMILFCILVMFSLATIFPLYYMIISSFGPATESAAAGFSLKPSGFSLDSYKYFFNFSPYSYMWFVNSFIVAASQTLLNVIFGTLAGYAFAKIKFPGRNFLFGLFMVAMMVPYQATQVPLYILMVNKLRLADTYAALILPGLVTVYNIFIAKQFMGGIPTELIESAKIEGCNQFKIFLYIVLPLSKTLIAVMSILTFVGAWNNYFWPLLVVSKPEMQTIQLGLSNFRFANTTYHGPMMAGATLSCIPMFILFFSMQKYFLEGVTVGAVKG